MNPKVIGISGNAGAGKTTLAKALSQALKATFLSWDDFDDISKGPDDYVEWFYRGQNYNEWDYSTLANVLASLKSNQSVIHPALNFWLNSSEYVIFDAPLGRLHEQTGRYIDIWIHIAVPLDVSLSRHLIRDFKDNDKTKEELLAELEYYLSHSRPLFFDNDLKNNADFVVDGTLNIDQEIEEIKKYLKEKIS